MKHVKDRNGRYPDDPEVIAEWIARRKARFPGKKKPKDTGPIPQFEAMLRKGAASAHGLNVMMRSGSAMVPSLPQMLKRDQDIFRQVFATRPNNNAPVPARRARIQAQLQRFLNKPGVVQGKHSIPHNLLREPFMICDRILAKKECKFGSECKQSHDLAAYYR